MINKTIFFSIFLLFSFSSSEILKLRKIKSKYPSLRSLSPLSDLYGNSDYLCYYYAYLYLGNNPAKPQSYIVDTGSDITTSPCKPFCYKCGTHENGYYEVNENQVLDCKNPYCSLINSSCGKKGCSFSISYSEGSSLSGLYVNHTVRFGKDYEKEEPFYFPIGCTTSENNLFFDQLADGIMGLSNSNRNFISVLHNQGRIKENIFSLCLALDGGYFSIGEIDTTMHYEDITYINIKSGGFYYINLNKVSLGDKEMALGSEYSFFIDSGTTMTYLPTKVYNFIIDTFKEVCDKPENKGKCGTYKVISDVGPCFVFNSEDDLEEAVYNVWPNITYTVDGKYSYVLSPFDYFFYDDEFSDFTGCLGILKGGNRGTLGSTWLHGHDIIFDRPNNRIGIAKADCSGYQNDNEGEDEDFSELLKTDEDEETEDDELEETEAPEENKSKEEEKCKDKDNCAEDKAKEDKNKNNSDIDDNNSNSDDSKNNQNKDNNKEEPNTNKGLIIFLVVLVIILGIILIFLTFGLLKLRKGENFLCFKFKPISSGYHPNLEITGDSINADNNTKEENKSNNVNKVEII